MSNPIRIDVLFLGQLPPFSYFKALPMKGNTLLLKECQNFERIRFFGPHKADHVFGELLQSPDIWSEILQKIPSLSALMEGLLAL